MLFTLHNVVKATPSADEKGDLEGGFFWNGECEPSSRPASLLIIVSKESGKNPWDSRKCVPLGELSGSTMTTSI